LEKGDLTHSVYAIFSKEVLSGSKNRYLPKETDMRREREKKKKEIGDSPERSGIELTIFQNFGDICYS